MDIAELNKSSERDHRFQTMLYWTAAVCVVAILATFVVIYFCQRVTVTGHSMEPSLADGDVVLIDRARYQFCDPGRFDVILFEAENNSAVKSYVKRIVGLPGETLQIIDGLIYIDGGPLDTDDELSWVTLSGLADEEILLGDDEYFVLGDNRDSSEDSRFAYIGNVSRSQIMGKVWFRISPFADISLIH